MAKTFLSFGLDPALLDAASPAFARQRGYFAGAQATLVVFRVGEEGILHHEGMTVIGTGGASKLAALVRGARIALRQAGTDVVLSQDAGPLGLLAWMIAKKLGTRLFLQDHAGLFARPAFGLRETLFRPLSAWLYRHADRIRVVSERARRGLVRIGAKDERITVFPIRSDVSRFAGVRRHPAAPPQIVCVARLEHEKGLELLLASVARMERKAECLIIGMGSRREALATQAERLGIASRVTFLGQKTAGEIAEIFATASAYVQPSVFEGWGMAVVEAAAAGLPIVMTDVGCAGELFRDGESAVVVPVGDAARLAAGLDRVLSDPAWATGLGNRARTAALALPGPEEGVLEMRRWLMEEGA